MSDAQKILIVDDDETLASMLQELLQTENYVCASAHNGQQALQLVNEFRPNLVVLDVMMPGMDGIETLRTLRETSTVAVIMLTAMGEDDDRILGLEAGADDYLAKPFVPRELVLRIQAILRRNSAPSLAATDNAPIQAGPLVIDKHKNRAELHGDALPLTRAERRILEALANSAGQVVSREQLTRDALGRELTPYDRALDTHISHLRRKLSDVNGSAGVHIHSARGAGYQLVID